MAIRVGRGEIRPIAEGVLRGTPREGRIYFNPIALWLAMTRPPVADAATIPAVAATGVAAVRGGPAERGALGRQLRVPEDSRLQDIEGLFGIHDGWFWKDSEYINERAF